MKAKKSYGQHFLINEEIAERIANSLKREFPYDKLLEIGPGRCMLTKYLLETDFELFAVEADRDMVAFIQKYYPVLKSRLIPMDFMKLHLDQLFPQENFGIIGNFPYNISSQILFRMLEHKAQVPELVGMFQKEMAERVVAQPGSKTYGVISVLVQAYYTGEYLFDVTPDNFAPPPRVQSAVIRLLRIENRELGCSYKAFRRVVKQTFGQRRKMLRNTMKSFLKDKPILNEPFFKQRPEQLSVEDFVWLTNLIEEENDNK